MKKIMLAIVVLTMFVMINKSYADDEQSDKEGPASTMMAGGNILVGMPAGTWSDYRTTGFGFQAYYEYKVSPTFAFDGSLGYMIWGIKDKKPGLNYSSSSMPILIGGKYYMPSPGYSIYIGLDLGAYIFSYKEGDLSSPHTDIAAVPSLGVLYPITDKININVGFNYPMIFTKGYTTSWYGVNIGLMFAL